MHGCLLIQGVPPSGKNLIQCKPNIILCCVSIYVFHSNLIPSSKSFCPHTPYIIGNQGQVLKTSKRKINSSVQNMLVSPFFTVLLLSKVLQNLRKNIFLYVFFLTIIKGRNIFLSASDVLSSSLYYPNAKTNEGKILHISLFDYFSLLSWFFFAFSFFFFFLLLYFPLVFHLHNFFLSQSLFICVLM